jgi:membrane-bound metal-dependent hydrolase YbcI (DUF457 family)
MTIGAETLFYIVLVCYLISIVPTLRNPKTRFTAFWTDSLIFLFLFFLAWCDGTIERATGVWTAVFFGLCFSTASHIMLDMTKLGTMFDLIFGRED